METWILHLHISHFVYIDISVFTLVRILKVIREMIKG